LAKQVDRQKSKGQRQVRALIWRRNARSGLKKSSPTTANPPGADLDSLILRDLTVNH